MRTNKKNDVKKLMLLEIINYISSIRVLLNKLDFSSLIKSIDILNTAIKNKKTVYVMGNGGSAATASHFVCDINKMLDKKLAAVSLVDSIPTITACANDTLYSEIFIQQLRGTVKKGDIVVAFSGSGNSENVVSAVKYANKAGAVTIGIVGFSGGKLKSLCDHSIHVPLDDMQICEDVHLMISHILIRSLQIIIGK